MTARKEQPDSGEQFVALCLRPAWKDGVPMRADAMEAVRFLDRYRCERPASHPGPCNFIARLAVGR